jgi:signal transduction histidine kinase
MVVRDQGIGIEAEDRERIFERYTRLVPVARYAGFGVGLWLVRRIVEAHGGSVAVTSAPGAGSTFTVELPRGPFPAGLEPAAEPGCPARCA